MGKSINIKNEEVAALVAELTTMTGKGTTELVLELLKREAEFQRRIRNLEKHRREVDKILARARKKIPPGIRSTDDLIGYGPDGLPE
jgi:antitoxin VapB